MTIFTGFYYCFIYYFILLYRTTYNDKKISILVTLIVSLSCLSSYKPLSNITRNTVEWNKMYTLLAFRELDHSPSSFATLAETRY